MCGQTTSSYSFRLAQEELDRLLPACCCGCAPRHHASHATQGHNATPPRDAAPHATTALKMATVKGITEAKLEYEFASRIAVLWLLSGAAVALDGCDS